jgi:pimeloyl-ACP methyl ester carboxylesterase
MSCTVNIKAAEISNPTLIFSPGAWHTGAAFKPTTDVLTKQGYKCIALDLPTIGSELRNESPPQSWDPDVSHIRSTILEELDEKNVNVILVVHSYSGTVGSEACKGLDEKSRKAQGKRTWVKSLVYLSAIVMDVGAYIWEYSNGKPLDERRTIMKVRALLNHC